MSVTRTQNEDTLLDLETLGAELKDLSYDVRRTAVCRLETIGDHRAVELLCQALKDGTSGVSIAAAEALARIGNPAAVPALTRALRSHRIIAVPRRQRIAGLVLLVLCLAFGLGPATLSHYLPSGNGFLAACMMLSFVCFCVRSTLSTSSDAHRAIAQALADLAVRSGSLEARDALADLRTLGSDLFAEDRRTRKAYRQAAEAIETATTAHQDVPLPHDPFNCGSSVFPVAVTATVLESNSLPRAAEQEGVVG